MATIDIKLKTYDELTFEIMRLNTDIYLLQQRINEAIEFINIAFSWLNIDLRDDDEILQVKAKFFKEITQILQGEDND